MLYIMSPYYLFCNWKFVVLTSFFILPTTPNPASGNHLSVFNLPLHAGNIFLHCYEAFLMIEVHSIPTFSELYRINTQHHALLALNCFPNETIKFSIVFIPLCPHQCLACSLVNTYFWMDKQKFAINWEKQIPLGKTLSEGWFEQFY